jgi:hypothetical protein
MLALPPTFAEAYKVAAMNGLNKLWNEIRLRGAARDEPASPTLK